MPPKLIVEVLGDTSNLEKSFRRSTKAADNFGRSISNAGRGAVAASLSFRGLGRSIGLVSASFLGGAGVVAALKSTIGAATESQRVLGQTENAVKRTGQSWAQFGKTVERVALAQSQVSGFDDERLLGTFSALVRSTRDVNEALRLNALAANVARGANIDLEQATKIVLRASQGQARGLAVLGVTVQKGAKGFEILRQIQQKFANSAVTFGNTAAGAQDRFRVAIENFQEVLGREALPAITRYLNRGADWLNQTENQQRALEFLRSAVKLIQSVVAGLTPFVKGAATAAQAFSDAVGGAANAVKTLVVVIGTLKFAALVTGFRAAGAAATTAAGGVSLLRGRLLALRALGAISIPIIIGTEIILNKDAIDRKVTGFLRDNNLGFLTGDQTRFANKAAVEAAAQGGGLQARLAQELLKKLDNRPSGTNFDAVEAGKRGPRIGGFGIQGAGTAGQLKPSVLKTLGLDRLIPRNLQLQEAQARTELEQRRVFAEKLAVINKKLRGRLAFDDRLALEQEKTSILSALESMNQAEIKARQSGQKQVADAAKKAREKALKDAVASIRTGQLGVKGGLTLAQVNQAVSANQQAAQFRQLGLTSTGEQRAPTARGLLRLSDRLISRAEPGKLENRVKSIRKVIVANFKGMSDDVRRTVRGMLDDIDSQLKDRSGTRGSGFRHGSPNKLAELLVPGLSRGQKRQLAAGLSQLGPNLSVPSGRGGGVNFNGPVTQHFHGVQNFRELENNLARSESRRAQVRRGAR